MDYSYAVFFLSVKLGGAGTPFPNQCGAPTSMKHASHFVPKESAEAEREEGHWAS